MSACSPAAGLRGFRCHSNDVVVRLLAIPMALNGGRYCGSMVDEGEGGGAKSESIYMLGLLRVPALKSVHCQRNI